MSGALSDLAARRAGLEPRVVPGPSDAPLLVAAGICKRYGHVVALEDVSVTVARGEVLGLAGENGSGKSTLVRILAGGLSADGGQVVVGGERRAVHGTRSGLDARIALVSQEPAAVPGMSVAENVLLASLRRPWTRVRRRELEERALPLLRLVGLDLHPARRLASLTQAERELVEIARALARSPELLILDEATSRLPDPERLFAVVESLRDEGRSTIFITHRLRELSRLADRVVVLRDGRRVGELARAEVTERRVSSMMVGRELSTFFHRGRAEVGRAVLRVDGLVVEGGRGAPISIEVRRGEIVGLAGLIGAGRTELLETIAGVRRYRRGRVVVDGREVRRGSTHAARSAGAALVPEDRHGQGLVLPLGVRENIVMGSRRAATRIRARAERALAERAVAELGIRAPGIDAPVRTLSGGNQQKVVIARALLEQPCVLLLDEPTRGIDVGAKEEIYEAIRGMVDAGMGLVVASSDLLELLGLADRIVVMHEGAVAGELDRAEATEERIALLSAGGNEVAGVA